MGGIFCAVAHENVIPNVVSGLAELECKGYDSAGLGALVDHQIRRRRARGPVSALSSMLADEPIVASTAIGHKRSTTHGIPSRRNAQPLASSRVAVVHDGIVENHAELRAELEREGTQFRSDTDSEVIVWLLDKEIGNRVHPLVAMKNVIARLRGTYAFAMICTHYDGYVFAARRGRPLAVGKARGVSWLASDAARLGATVDATLDLEDGEIAELRPGQVCVFDEQLAQVSPRWARARRRLRRRQTGSFVADSAYREILSQPSALAGTLRQLEGDLLERALEDWCGPLWRAERILAIGCGASYHVAHIARAWLEQIAGIPSGLELCSGLATREATLTEETTALVVAQSEDAETLRAVRYLRARGVPTVALVDGVSSALAAEVDALIDCRRGQEAGPLSARPFTSQLCALAAASIVIGRLRHGESASSGALASLFEVPRLMENALTLEDQCIDVAHRIVEAGSVSYAGRGTSYPLARFAALELGAVPSMYAEGLAGGELKHRLPRKHPLIIIAPFDETFDETFRDVREISERGGAPILVGDARTADVAERQGLPSIAVAGGDPLWSPIVLAVPLQLVAHHAVRARSANLPAQRKLPNSRSAVE